VCASFTSRPQAGPVGKLEALGPSRGIRQGEGLSWYWRRNKCECQWNEHISACVCLLASTELDQPVSGRLVEQVRRLRTWAGVLDGQRVCVSTWESTGVHSCEPIKCGVLAFTSDLLSLPAEEETGTWWAVQVFYANPECWCC